MNFSAVILAGGDSSRMGRDKAFLDCRGGTLLARQIRTVSALRPREILISGRPGTDYGAYGCRVLHDEICGCGPLAGIARGLAAVESPLALVLAVDMPAMRVGLLRWLAARCSEAVGAVPQVGSRLEPLAAFYPRSAGRLALELLTERALAVAHFATLCHEAGLVGLHLPPPRHHVCFSSWNRPEDVG